MEQNPRLHFFCSEQDEGDMGKNKKKSGGGGKNKQKKGAGGGGVENKKNSPAVRKKAISGPHPVSVSER